MKAITALASLFLLTLPTSSALAQARGISGNGFDSGTINVVPAPETPAKVPKKVTTIQFIAVSPKRTWQSSDKAQKPILGELLAFEREEKTGKLRIIQNEKVRLLVGKKDFTLPLSKLSADDQTYIRKLEDSARSAGKLIEPAKAEGKTKGETETNTKAESKEPAKDGKE